MTDKELLELAAKAYGIELGLCPDGNSGFWKFDWNGAWWTLYVNVDHPAIKMPEHCGKEFTQTYNNYVRCWEWSPLTDDGDALRLAVKCRIRFEIHHSEKFVAAFHNDLFGRIEEVINSDIYAATRRAIVRTAAEIAKAKGE